MSATEVFVVVWRCDAPSDWNPNKSCGKESDFRLTEKDWIQQGWQENDERYETRCPSCVKRLGSI